MIKEEKCWFDFCQQPFDPEEREYFKVILEGKLRRVHKRCYKKHCAEKTGIRMIIR